MKDNLQQRKTNSGELVEHEAEMARAINQDYELKYGFQDDVQNFFTLGKGISEDKVRQISKMKNEPEWMLEIRLKAYAEFMKRPMPQWGADLSEINFDDIHYFVKATQGQGRDWEDVPDKIKDTFEKLGIPQAERKFLAGVASQYESEVVYHKLKEEWSKLGVIFEDTDSGLQKYPEIFKKHFGKVIPYTDNKFAALNTAVWSGGSFIYVPKGVKVSIPLQAYFRINARNMGQFERTLIIVDEGAEVHYIEGCTAPTYTTDSLHSAVVEIVVERGARCRYTTIQNWSDNVYNLVTKRAIAKHKAVMEWVDCNLGSKVTMKYPSVYLVEPGAHGEVLSIALAGKGQHQDAGAKMIHRAKNTTSLILSKSICFDGGRTSYRGMVKIPKGATGCKSNVICDALILDGNSRTDTYPSNFIDEQDVSLGHEASVSRINEEQLFYLTSKGLTEEQASAMIIAGFIEPIVKELPMEYAMELNALIEMSMAGSVG
jgi:Fe-S cluster assembly protein SufB